MDRNRIVTPGTTAERRSERMKKALIIAGLLLCALLVTFTASADNALTLPAFLTCVEEYAFEGNTAVTRVVLPDGIQDIGEGSFCGCSSLASINIPGNVTAIGGSAFKGCTSLTSICIPEGVTVLGADAFSGCTSLTEISLPDSLTDIGEGAIPATATVICSSGSAAGRWCESNGVPCHTRADEPLSQNGNILVKAGENAVFHAEAEGAKSYQWQVLRADKPWVNTYLDGYNTSTLTVQANYNRAVLQWRCKITLMNGDVIYSEPAAMQIRDAAVTVAQNSSIQYDVPLYEQGQYRLCWDFSMQMVEDYMMGTVNPSDSRTVQQLKATEKCIIRAIDSLGNDWDRGYYPLDTDWKMLWADEDEVTAENLYAMLVNYGPGYLTYGQYEDGERVAGHSTVVTGIDLATGLITSNNPWGGSGTQTLDELMNGFVTGRHNAGTGWQLEFVDMPDWETVYGPCD
ncbi:MAG: hypothetical protein CW338_09275 [Clostridiales bacterium]|nr:hypothetical protein [Clostridiales bacterium]